MSGTSEPEIDKMRKKLEKMVSGDIAVPTNAATVEEFFNSLKEKGGATASADKIEDSFYSPFKKSWPIFTPSVTVAAAGATGVDVSFAGLEIVGTGLTFLTDVGNFDGAIFDQNACFAKNREAVKTGLEKVVQDLLTVDTFDQIGAKEGDQGALDTNEIILDIFA